MELGGGKGRCELWIAVAMFLGGLTLEMVSLMRWDRGLGLV